MNNPCEKCIKLTCAWRNYKRCKFYKESECN